MRNPWRSICSRAKTFCTRQKLFCIEKKSMRSPQKRVCSGSEISDRKRNIQIFLSGGLTDPRPSRPIILRGKTDALGGSTQGGCGAGLTCMFLLRPLSEIALHLAEIVLHRKEMDTHLTEIDLHKERRGAVRVPDDFMPVPDGFACLQTGIRPGPDGPAAPRADVVTGDVGRLWGALSGAAGDGRVLNQPRWGGSAGQLHPGRGGRYRHKVGFFKKSTLFFRWWSARPKHRLSDAGTGPVGYVPGCGRPRDRVSSRNSVSFDLSQHGQDRAAPSLMVASARRRSAAPGISGGDVVRGVDDQHNPKPVVVVPVPRIPVGAGGRCQPGPAMGAVAPPKLTPKKTVFKKKF